MSEVKPRGEGRRTLVLVTVGVVAALVLLFILLNSKSIEVNLGVTDVLVPLWLLVIVPFFLGLAVGWATKWWTGRR